jgi:hypothetical protein
VRRPEERHDTKRPIPTTRRPTLDTSHGPKESGADPRTRDFAAHLATVHGQDLQRLGIPSDKIRVYRPWMNNVHAMCHESYAPLASVGRSWSIKEGTRAGSRPPPAVRGGALRGPASAYHLRGPGAGTCGEIMALRSRCPRRYAWVLSSRPADSHALPAARSDSGPVFEDTRS